jgi:F-type H+-transporting ATPase subunit b
MYAFILAEAEHHPNEIILPGDKNEVIWGTIAFLIILFTLWKFAYQPAKDALIARRERIEADLAQASQARADAEAQLGTVRSQLSGADAERANLVEEARRTAVAIDKEGEVRIEREGVAARERAMRDLAASRQQAMADLQSLVSDLTLGATELVVRNNLDEATQTDLVEKYIAQLSNN